MKTLFPSWRLHLQIFKLGLQTNLVYRWNFLLRIIVSFVPLIGWIFFWGAVFADNRSGFPGYTYSTMLAYFITVLLIDTVTAPSEDDFQIAEEIREGQLNAFLLRPISYRIYRLHLFASARVIQCSAALVPLACALWLGLDRFYVGVPWLQNLPLTILAVLGSALLQFLFCYTLSMIAFWILEIGSVTFIVYSVEFLLNGHLVPIDAFPPSVQRWCMATPFPYETFFPAAILLGHLHGWALAEAFILQAVWIAFFALAGWCLWSMGLRKYTAVGG